MSAVTIFKCDRCSKEFKPIDLTEGSIKLTIQFGSSSVFKTQLWCSEKSHFCTNCKNTIIEDWSLWMNKYFERLHFHG